MSKDVFEPESAGTRVREQVLVASGLGVQFLVDGTWTMASEGVDLQVGRGEVLAIVGESGSGKSVSCMGMLGLLPGNARVSGSAKLTGRELIGAREPALRAVRGKDVGLIFQEPMSALNPVLTIGFQIGEVLLSHFDLSPDKTRERVLELLRMVDMPDPERKYASYPHQLSGGQRQRVVIAMAIACEPVLLIADEPTTALDVTVQAEVLELLRQLHKRIDSAILLITHDMGVVADLADRVVVMRSGHIVETGDVRQIFADPREPYTQDLLSSVPHLGSSVVSGAADSTGLLADLEIDSRTGRAQVLPDAESVTVTDRGAAEPTGRAPVPAGVTPALEVTNLVVEYPGRGRIPAFRAVDDVSFTVLPGEVLGLVGESGSGKTTIGRAVVSLLPVSGGSVKIGGTEIKGLSQKQLRPMRERTAIVFQDPASSLNPRMSIGESIGEPLYLHRKLRRAELDKRVEKLLASVHLPTSYRNRYPHELSGGQRQRVGIARALSLEPELLVADEPTSALDVSVQARVLDLFKELQEQQGFACLFVTHDLAVVELLARQIAVLHLGKLAEIGSREQILRAPIDPYTRRLVAAAPVPDPDAQRARREERLALLAAGADPE